MGKFQFMAKLYGVRGSYPIAPETGTDIGGNTTCLMVRTQKQIVIFDAGSGLIKLGEQLIPEIIQHQKESGEPFHITFVFTHTHSDHLLGFPFFAPLYMPNVHLHFYGPSTLGVSFESILRQWVAPQYYPVDMDEFRSQKSFKNVNENLLLYFTGDDPQPKTCHSTVTPPEKTSLVVRNMKYYFHPKDGCYVYRVEWKNKKLVFATDVEQYDGLDQRLVNFAKGADYLIHDSQYTPDQYKNFSGYGHSTYTAACKAGKEADVKKLLLFHHHPTSTDDDLRKLEKAARKVFERCELATEKWEWIL